jgi:hypothetical protein
VEWKLLHWYLKSKLKNEYSCHSYLTFDWLVFFPSSPTETTNETENTERRSSEETRRLLVCSTDSYQSIDALSTVVINSDTMTSHPNPLGVHRPYSPQFASSVTTEGSDVEWSFSWNGDNYTTCVWTFTSFYQFWCYLISI